MYRIISAVLFVLLFVGCASVQTVAPQFYQGNFPELKTTSTVNVGQVMVSEYDYLSRGTAILREDLSGSFWMSRNDVVAGTELISAISGGEQVYCLSRMSNGSACVKDVDNDGFFDRAYTMNLYGMLVNGVDIAPVRYRAANQDIQDGFKYELLYQGIDENVVHITYREYTDNLARPAFTQDLSYTLEDGPTKIMFKAVSIIINTANNSEITYIVESGF